MSERKPYSIALVPASVADARAKQLVPSVPSEDVRSLLVSPTVAPLPEHRPVGPNSKIHWIVEASLPDGSPMDTAFIHRRFDVNWKQTMGIDAIFGYRDDVKLFEYLRSATETQSLDRIVFAVKLVEIDDADLLVHDQDSLMHILESIRNRAQDDVVVTVREGVIDASRRAEAICDLVRSANLRIEWKLIAQDKPFDGFSVWDVMLCVGLKWGDMDMFHWMPHTEGPSRHFSVFSVSTPRPGGILPEEVAAGESYDELDFSFSVPRTVAPHEVLRALYAAAKYAQERLGGALLDENGAPVDLASEAAALTAVVSSFDAHGWKPGEQAALILFQK